MSASAAPVHAPAGDVTLRYFAWLREKVGVAEERVQLPPGLVTVADVLAWQATRGPQFVEAFAKPGAIRVALDHVHAKGQAPLGAVREIGFFPPVTGG